MKFALVIKLDEPAKGKLVLIQMINQALQAFFSERNYGEDVEDYLLLLICVGSNVEHLFTVNKPTYVYHKISKNRFTGLPVEMYKVFLNEAKFETAEYDAFLSADDEMSRKLLIQKILSSLANLDLLPKKVKDFDKVRFKSDMIGFLNENL